MIAPGNQMLNSTKRGKIIINQTTRRVKGKKGKDDENLIKERPQVGRSLSRLEKGRLIKID
jgi:hypothetical protein